MQWLLVIFVDEVEAAWARDDQQDGQDRQGDGDDEACVVIFVIVIAIDYLMAGNRWVVQERDGRKEWERRMQGREGEEGEESRGEEERGRGGNQRKEVRREVRDREERRERKERK
jgi:hypothetical protein